MKTLEEFVQKADWEGGPIEFVVGYGVDTEKLRGTEMEPLIPKINALKNAADDYMDALDGLCHELGVQY